MSLRQWYVYFLLASEECLRWWIDSYNRGTLNRSENASIALEIIDGLSIDD